jgi:hypothetical protein
MTNILLALIAGLLLVLAVKTENPPTIEPSKWLWAVIANYLIPLVDQI